MKAKIIPGDRFENKQRIRTNISRADDEMDKVFYILAKEYRRKIAVPAETLDEIMKNCRREIEAEAAAQQKKKRRMAAGLLVVSVLAGCIGWHYSREQRASHSCMDI